MPRTHSALFDAVTGEIATLRFRPEIAVSASVGSTKLAPYSLTMNATVTTGGRQVADGRLVLLHDPAGQESWGGDWRLVLFASAELEDAMTDDPVLVDMGWEWLQEALGERDLALGAFGGTVTRTAAKSFGTLVDNPRTGDLEIRASWTPMIKAPHPRLRPATIPVILREHVAAWLDLLELITSLEPAIEGVAVLRPRR